MEEYKEVNKEKYQEEYDKWEGEMKRGLAKYKSINRTMYKVKGDYEEEYKGNCWAQQMGEKKTIRSMVLGSKEYKGNREEYQEDYKEEYKEEYQELYKIMYGEV